MSEKTKDVLEWIYCIIIAVALALIIRYFVGTPTVVQQPSMFPTLQSGQRLILNRFTVRVSKKMPERGQIVTFEAPIKNYITTEEYDPENPIALYDDESRGFFGRFVNNVLEIGKTSYIKRVIGLPGEHVQIIDGKVYINNEELQETYLQDNVVTESLGGLFTDLYVPENCLFLMGDNRSQSTDSRRFGCIPFDKIEGVVAIRFWPFNLFGKVE